MATLELTSAAKNLAISDFFNNDKARTGKEYPKDDKNCITDFLENATTLNKLIVRSNIQDDENIIENIMVYVNTSGLAASQSIIGSTVIHPGTIGLLSHNGCIQVAGPGRWICWNPRASWLDIKSLNDTIQTSTLTIVRIPKGHYGLAIDAGKPIILGEGLHVRNDRLFKYYKTETADQEHINHKTAHIIRIPEGKYGKVIDNNIPKLLKSGFYVIDSNYFTYSGLVDSIDQLINHQTIHLLRVFKNNVCGVTVNNKPMLLKEGNYSFNTQLFSYDNVHNVNDDLIKHSTITRFRVKNGEIASAWYKNKPLLISEPGIHEIDDPTFIFDKCVPATTKLIKLGSRTRYIINNGEFGLVWENSKPIFKEEPGVYDVDDATFVYYDVKPATTKQIALGSRMRILVNDGEVGISYREGKLNILNPGKYNFDSNDCIFSGFMSTKQQSIELIEDVKDPWLRCDTKDFVEIGIKAVVFFKVGDPGLTLLTIGETKAIEKIVRDTSIATIQGIMRCSPLSQVAQSKIVNAKDDKTTTAFFDKVHDEFISKLYETFKKTYGLEISNIRIEDFKIMDEALANSISKQAMTTAQNENALANLESQREIATAQQERDATVNRIKTQAAALQLTLETEAKTNALLIEAQIRAKATELSANAEANAASVKIQATAKANAYSIITIAEAEARGIEMKSAAEKKRAENLASTDIGQQLALLTIQADMITKSLQGVEKIIYLPPGSNMGNLPYQLFGMKGGLPMLESASDKNSKK